MEELISMGFSRDLASQALAATGGGSALVAADWILNTTADGPTAVAASSSPPQSSSQSTIARFFPSKSPRLASPPPPPKRPKPPPASSQPAICPLPERMRPQTLDLVLGQDHLLGPSSILRSSIDGGSLPSILLWGPPGSGKTTIARAIAAALPDHHFISLSAVTAGVKDVRAAAEDARLRRRRSRTVLFVDEVHRFTKAQQDSFLPAVEDGSIVFIGATTENPSFHITTPLLSRSRVLTLQPLKSHHVEALLQRALADEENGVTASIGGGGGGVSAKQESLDFLSLHCDGDARVALNALEAATLRAAGRRRPAGGIGVEISLEDAKEAMQSKHLAYDRAGEEHYNLISALHKSMRGSDPDASMYWLARMLEGGEQPLYIARRLVRFAGEDVGLADPAALGVAVACYQACHFVGMPECDVSLAQCVAYLALAPKSVAVYKALGAARKAVRESAGGNEGVPLHLRNAPTRLMEELGYGEGYVYPPDHPEGLPQAYLPPSLQGFRFLNWPPKQGEEEEKQERS